MRSGKYEASDSGSSVAAACTLLLIGFGAGALIGLIFAPKAGRQFRKDLRKKYHSARESIEDWTDDAKDFAEVAMERGAGIADEVRDKVAPLAKVVRW
jgi:gas vesicle protein